ncbi:MAG: cyclic nucleotide-binding domain-containing protein [Desulfamplus sp.]|nr:cyclic nucleotide-binding domain-containing protein [Desulfamplus sp.]MBF0411081.1 cyclic nucleotide-binding domain-containing protein [Desulfamplus sp.]
MVKAIKKNLINDATIDLLSRFEILKDLTKDELKKLLRGRETDYEVGLAKLIRYEPNEVVIREGDFDSWTFWIVKGVYKVIIGGCVITTLSTPGDIFGEMSVLEGLPRTASVLSVEEGICLGIDMSVLGNLDDEYITHVISLGFKQKKLERINTTRTQLIKEKHDLDIKYTNMLKLDRILRKKEAAFINREEEIAKRESEIARREEEMLKRASEIVRREAEIARREAEAARIMLTTKI